MWSRGHQRARRRGALAVVVLATVLAVPATAAPPASTVAPASPIRPGDDRDLYLVTLRGAGTAASRGVLPRSTRDLRLVRRQDDVLAAVGSPEPVYRWTRALDGFAVRLDEQQAAALGARPEVLAVEADTVLPMAAADRGGPAATVPSGPRHGGAGVVVGLVDSGLAPDSPLFAQRTLEGRPPGFAGSCETAGDWAAAECNGKIVGARWYVEGFGADRLRAATSLSPRDTDGHGTGAASLAVGNPRVPVRIGSERLGRFGGLAPDARLAVYKACWSAPDPADDGCASADIVAAIDDATRDGVDVLGLAVGGPPELDTVDRALLGAAEAGVVVVTASGNEGPGTTAHAAPWVTTVGGTSGETRHGRVRLPGGRAWDGAMLSRRRVGPARAVLAARAAVPRGSRAAARVCRPGSLDAAEVAGRIVVCERGRVGRVDKSRAVALADGGGMVLLNRGAGSVDADAHSVPTVHLPVRRAAGFRRWLRAHPRALVSLRPAGLAQRRVRVSAFSGSDAGTGVLKPDLVAPADGVLAATAEPPGWTFVTGTSAAGARTVGAAARMLGRGLRPGVVRSALTTTARPLPRGPVARSGGGLLRGQRALDPGLAYLLPARAYRAWLNGRRADLNTPSVVLRDGVLTAHRTITNVSGRRLYFSSTARRFRRPVTVRPAAVRLGRGESATFTIRVGAGGGARIDDGYVVWRGATGSVTRIPVVVAR